MLSSRIGFQSKVSTLRRPSRITDKTFRCLQTPLFTVKVGRGENTKSFLIHQKILMDCSPYFAGLIGSPFQEAQTGCVHLDDESDDVDAFGALALYMYSGYNSAPNRFRVNKDKYLSICGLDDKGKFTRIAKAFVMAGRLCMDYAQKQAIYRMRQTLAHDNSEFKAEGCEENCEDICKAVDIVYSSTVAPTLDEPPKANAKPSGKFIMASAWEFNYGTNSTKDQNWLELHGTGIQGRMRLLLARFCGSHISRFSSKDYFNELLECRPDFCRDILSMMRPAAAVSAE